MREELPTREDDVGAEATPRAAVKKPAEGPAVKPLRDAVDIAERVIALMGAEARETILADKFYQGAAALFPKPTPDIRGLEVHRSDVSAAIAELQAIWAAERQDKNPLAA